MQIKNAQNGALFSNYADEMTVIELPIIKDTDVETEIKFGNIFESLIAIKLFSFFRIKPSLRDTSLFKHFSISYGHISFLKW